ncbi:MAG: LEA type 2 family protein [Thermoanaerobaculia bacterium]
MRLRGSGAAAAAAVMAAALGCAVWKKPTVEFEAISLHRLSQDGASLDVKLRVQNPNGYNIVVRHFTYRLAIGSSPVGGGESPADVRVEARSESTVSLPVQLDWRNLKARGLDFLLSGGVEYSVEGEVTFSTPIGTFVRPYLHAGRFSPLGDRSGL